MKFSKLFAGLALITAACGLPVSQVAAQGTTFTYQGRLNAQGVAANGNYDLTFALYDAPSGGNAVGLPLTNSAVAVSNGLFTITLDFGPGVFSGANRWLEIGVRTNGSQTPFATLSPRQQTTATPYAIQALGAARRLQSPPGPLLARVSLRERRRPTFKRAANPAWPAAESCCPQRQAPRWQRRVM